ncbi:MAG: 50S ribosomal protein L25 [Candidatus Buchananbacteria bacterium]|nr:50S ribosomal protein L25 [Candidatus Buchananbacteria bacterium]
MENLSLNAKVREVAGKDNQQLRDQAQIPAVIYGHGIKNVNLSVDYSAFDKVYNQAGESTLVDLIVDGKEPVKVIIADVQLDSVTNKIIHIDFHQVRMDEKITADVELKFIGEAPAVKNLGCILVTQLNELEVECLPTDLVHEIEIDLSSLQQPDDMIHVSQIQAPKGVEILNQPDAVIAMVQLQKEEKEEPVVSATPAGEVPLVDDKKKEESTAEEKKS